MTNEVLTSLIKWMAGSFASSVALVLLIGGWVWSKKYNRDEKLHDEAKDKEIAQDLALNTQNTILTNIAESTKNTVGQITVLNNNYTEIMKTQVGHKKILDEVTKNTTKMVDLFTSIKIMVEKHDMDIDSINKQLKKIA